MTRVLLLVDQLSRSQRTGIDLYYDKLVHWLPRLAPHLDFTLVSLGEPDQHLASFAPNLRHRGVRMSRRRFVLLAMLGLVSPLKPLLDQVGLVHLMMPFPLVTSKPLLVTVHDLTPLLLPRFYRWYHRLVTYWSLRYLIAQDCHFSVVSDCTGRDLRNLFHIPENRVHRVYEGVGDKFQAACDAQRIQQARARYGLPHRYFLFIGSMHKRKNLPTLLQAFGLFKARDETDTGLVLAGRMDLGGEELRRQVRERGLQASVILPGYIDSADLPAVIGGAVALLYPSLYEGFGLPALEAMACGTPVIGSTAGSIPEVTGGHALLCDPMDVACFAKAMSRITSDASLRATLVRDGRNWAKRFSWQASAEATLRLYDELLEGGL